uniref:HAD hydrolase family protein n=1 Tax=Catenibacterium sp. TaxID=2049022 RepID=UPI003079263B
ARLLSEKEVLELLSKVRLVADIKDVVVFGDGENDLVMFKKEWTSIAMGNGVEDLKKKADFVTKDSTDDGVEYACRHFGWID